MMLSEDSPFDQAAAQPMLGEPAKKKFQWPWIHSVTKAVSSEKDRSISVDYREYEAPTLTYEINFCEEETALLNRDLEEGLMVDGNDALWRERHENISEINSSMRYINDIQKDLSNLVNSQQESINEMESMAIETFDHATNGLNHLARIQKQFASSSKRRKQMLAASATLFLVVVFAQWLSADVDGDEDPTPYHH